MWVAPPALVVRGTLESRDEAGECLEQRRLPLLGPGFWGGFSSAEKTYLGFIRLGFNAILVAFKLSDSYTVTAFTAAMPWKGAANF